MRYMQTSQRVSNEIKSGCYIIKPLLLLQSEGEGHPRLHTVIDRVDFSLGIPRTQGRTIVLRYGGCRSGL